MTRLASFGTVLENACWMSTRARSTTTDDTLTENTRAAIRRIHPKRVDAPASAGHPKNIIFLTCDAFGVLPPIAKLTPEQASYYFLSGYTAKVAGTERGLTEPEATFSTAFGAVFMTLPQTCMGGCSADKIRQHQPDVWFINTGWTGGPYGVGKRISIAHTRAIVHAALEGLLDQVEFREDPIFRVQVPLRVPDVPSDVLVPSNTWQSEAEYDVAARALAQRFVANFEQYADKVDEDIQSTGPTPIISPHQRSNPEDAERDSCRATPFGVLSVVVSSARELDDVQVYGTLEVRP